MKFRTSRCLSFTYDKTFYSNNALGAKFALYKGSDLLFMFGYGLY